MRLLIREVSPQLDSYPTTQHPPSYLTVHDNTTIIDSGWSHDERFLMELRTVVLPQPPHGDGGG